MGTQFQDDSEMVLALLRGALSRATADIGESASQIAADITPVDTGRARNSITYATQDRQGVAHQYTDNQGNSYADEIGQGVQEGEVYIGTNVEYFQYIENGSITIDAHHPLQRAASEHGEEYRKIMKEHMENA